jgi:ubiquinone/menaquinone biosynthesis C-methylase UbiE
MRRIVRPEWLDSQQASPDELKRSLEDLRFINRWFGGLSTSKWLVHRVLSETRLPSLSILDVGAASGDGLEAVQRAFTQCSIRGTLLDRNPANFNGTRGPKVGGDATALPFRDQSFDVVICSLFAHHLEPGQLVQFANEALRVSRVAVLVNDLRRSYFHLSLIYAGLPLFSRVTRHDSVASVLRAYTPREMERTLREANASRVEVHNHFLCRMGAIAWK